jgi:hypothetical protein
MLVHVKLSGLPIVMAGCGKYVASAMSYGTACAICGYGKTACLSSNESSAAQARSNPITTRNAAPTLEPNREAKPGPGANAILQLDLQTRSLRVSKEFTLPRPDSACLSSRQSTAQSPRPSTQDGWGSARASGGHRANPENKGSKLDAQRHISHTKASSPSSSHRRGAWGHEDTRHHRKKTLAVTSRTAQQAAMLSFAAGESIVLL